MKQFLFSSIIACSFSASFAQEGVLDATYGTAGIVETTENHTAYAIAIQTDGKIIFAGSKWDAAIGVNFGIFRHNSDGSVDMTFGTNGTTSFDFFTASDEIKGIEVLSNGKILVAGIIVEASTRKLGLARLNADGSIDNTFGTSGKVVLAIPSATNLDISSMKLLPSGKILIAGTTDGYSTSVIIQLDASGNLDTAFDTDGIYTTSTLSTIQSLAIQSDGKILASGASTFNAAIIRLNANGSSDNTFGVNGKYTNSTMLFGGLKAFVDLTPDGQILSAFGSSASTTVSYMKLTSSGTLDNSYATSGVGLFDVAGNDYPNAMKALANGKMVITGSGYINSSTTDGYIARVNADGTMDNSFGTNGVTITSIRPTEEDNFLDLEIQADGKVVIVGNQCGGSCRYTSARYTSSNGVGVSEITNNTFTIYPNPVQHTLNIQAIDLNSIENYSIITLDGKTMQRDRLNQASIDLSNLESGVYLLQLTSIDGTIATTRFFKQ